MTQAPYHCKTDAQGTPYAGEHLLVEFWGASGLDDPELLRAAVEKSARKARATILHSYYHPFGEGQGVSGVTVLAESHITIHTWPELGYAAIDIFMCGDCDPNDCIPVLEAYLRPAQVVVDSFARGRPTGARAWRAA